ncbi:hypothetical protein KAI87_06245, partial [Myxococcota bacterium]|nr:hypothetical protein [Myxococcota bacterium]
MTSQLFRFTRLTFGFAGLFFLFACASSGTAVYQSGPRFPAKSQVEELAQKPAPEIKLTKDIKTVELWELQGDLPDTLGFRPIKTKPDATQNFVLAIVGNAKEVTFTEGMACVARQHAKFTLAQKSQSDDQLANFISARCGTTGYAIRRSHVAGDINPAESDGDILKRWSDLISTYVSGFAGGGPKVLGVHLERSEKSAVLSVAYAAYNLRLDDTSAFVDAKNRFVLKGQSMDANIKRLSAYLNWGASESRECVVNEAVKLPLFEILCEASPGDKTILIEVASFKNDVLLGRNALRTLVRRADEPARVYRQHILPEMTDEDFPEEAAPEFLIRLNRVRKEAGLSQLRYEAVQSDLASRLAPHYFAVGMGLLPELWSEQIALGLLAG